VDFLDTNRFTPEIAKALVARRKPFGIYNGAGDTPAGARFFFGFYGWKTAACSVAQWNYHFGNSVFEGDGLRKPDDGYVYHASDGPLPSLMWEAVREGIDDYRYLDLLWRMITAARRTDEAAAVEAEKVVREIMEKIPWTFQALDSAQRSPPPSLDTLQQWRWQIAQQILKMPQVHGSVVVPTRSPFDFVWAEPPRTALNFGPELLPASSFETDMKPWRIEAWKGAGTARSTPLNITAANNPCASRCRRRAATMP